MNLKTEGATLCLVDGTYELFRAFYGPPGRKSSTGLEIGATVGLGKSLLSLARSGRFSHLAVAFDSVVESFRNELFEGYKTGEGMDPALFAQFPLAEKIAEALGLCVLRMVEFEADDALCTLAARFASDPRVGQVVIASPDKDLMQCVSPGVVTWDRMREKYYDEAAVVEKMGVPPSAICDYLALVGDSADGIPGIPRWGARSSSLLLRRYGNIASIPGSASEWDIKVRGAAALAEQLRAHRKELALYRTLATLRRDVPLEIEWEDLEYRGTDPSKCAQLSEELGVSLGDW